VSLVDPELHLRIEVREDPETLAVAIAEAIDALSRAEGDEPVHIALSGGKTPMRLYETLAMPPFLTSVDWKRLVFWFGDERPVPPDHPDSNAGMATKALLAKVKATVYRMIAERGEANEYEALIRERVTRQRRGIPIFDLILLGMGEDGHTASLFAGTRALEEQKRLVVMNQVPQKQTTRMTFTYPLINAADRIWAIITGAHKREKLIVARAAWDRHERPFPFAGVRPVEGELVWWVDRAANPE
jgi:6-phosphogluconolactonase